MSIFGTNHIDARRTHERLVVHELAHRWRQQPHDRRRRHIWFNEGFATYAEWLWSEASGGRAAGAHVRERHAHRAAKPADLVDEWVYKCGALVLHALRARIGDERFFALLRDWAAAPACDGTTARFVELAGLQTPPASARKGLGAASDAGRGHGSSGAAGTAADRDRLRRAAGGW